MLQNVYEIFENIIERTIYKKFKSTKNELHDRYFPGLYIDNYLCFMTCGNFKNIYFKELLSSGFYFLPGFFYKINASRYSIVKSYFIHSLFKASLKGTLMEIWKSINIFVFTYK